MMDSAMFWTSWWGHLLIYVLVVLAVAALVKYVFFK